MIATLIDITIDVKMLLVCSRFIQILLAQFDARQQIRKSTMLTCTERPHYKEE
jgi:hypothetical protein